MPQVFIYKTVIFLQEKKCYVIIKQYSLHRDIVFVAQRNEDDEARNEETTCTNII